MEISKDYSDTESGDGSLSKSEPDFLMVGKLGRPHGTRGEIFMQIHTDFPERIKRNYQVFIGEKHLPVRVKSQRKIANGYLISFESFDSPESLKYLTSQYVFVRTDQVPKLPEGEYYHHEIIGLTVVDEENRTLGTVSQILQTGSNDVLVVRSENGRENLIPVIDDIIISFDIKDQVVIIRLIEGLIDT